MVLSVLNTMVKAVCLYLRNCSKNCISNPVKYVFSSEPINKVWDDSSGITQATSTPPYPAGNIKDRKQP